ncbi:MAG TPA: hypothetical protein VIL35_03730 [Vicinamibacterales bacterium]
MSRVNGLLGSLAVAVAVALTACATRAPNIADLRQDPGRYMDRNVTVEGRVSSSWSIPLVQFGLYKVEDETGEVTVVSRSRRTPGKGARVRVTGRLTDVASFGQSLGLHIQERDVDVLRN